jgi:nitrous oxide reductase
MKTIGLLLLATTALISVSALAEGRTFIDNCTALAISAAGAEAAKAAPDATLSSLKSDGGMRDYELTYYSGSTGDYSKYQVHLNFSADQVCFVASLKKL